MTDIQRVYSTHRSIQILSKLMLLHQIKHIILCPGSRNAPIVQTVASQPEFTCYAVADERSAAFIALGIASKANAPVAICCTSGSALTNFMPAISEAFYRNIPLLVLSADRPTALINQKVGQTMQQAGLLNAIVNKSVNLPEVHTNQDDWYCNRLVNDALLTLKRSPKGPVHINIPISEPLFGYKEGILPETRIISELHTYHSPDLTILGSWWQEYPKRMIVLGQTAPNEFDLSLLQAIGKRGDCLFIAEHIGNTKGCAITNFDYVISQASEEELALCAPDLLITLGGHIVSKRLSKLLKSYPPKKHLAVNTYRDLVDTYQCLTVNVPCSDKDLLNALINISEVPGSNYKGFWKNISNKSPQLPSFIYSDLSILQKIVPTLPKNATIHLANSTIVRSMQLFALSPSLKVFANRGISGIDGTVSTALGSALVSKDENFLFVGDLAFFYDMNALWFDMIPKNLTIIMINNASGEIFHLLPQMRKGEALNKFIAHEHQTTAKGWVEERGFDYQSVHNKEELNEVIEWLTLPHEKPRFIEAFTTIESTTKAFNQLKRNNND